MSNTISRILKTVTGIWAAVGAYKAVLLCMACVFFYGLCAGWVQPLFVGGDHPSLWIARSLALWAILGAIFWRVAGGPFDKFLMLFSMLIVSGTVISVIGAVMYCDIDTENIGRKTVFICMACATGWGVAWVFHKPNPTKMNGQPDR